MIEGIGLICFAISFESGTKADTGISPVVFTAPGIRFGAGAKDEDFGIGCEDEDLMIPLEVWIIQRSKYFVSRLYRR